MGLFRIGSSVYRFQGRRRRLGRAEPGRAATAGWPGHRPARGDGRRGGGSGGKCLGAPWQQLFCCFGVKENMGF